MRHNVSGRKLGRKSSHRKAMFRNMVASLIEHGRIKTTLHKAKELRRIADSMVTLGKANTLSARRQAFDFMRNKLAVKKLFAEIAPSFEERKGGYTRIYHLGHRMGDAAKMAIIEYLSEDLLSARVEGKVSDKKNDKKKKAKSKKDDSKKKTAKKVAKTSKKESVSKPKKEASASKKETKTKVTATKKTPAQKDAKEDEK